MKKQATEQLIREVRDQLLQEPALSDPSKIAVNLEKRGGLFNRKTVVTIDGKVKNETELRKAAKLVETKMGTAVQLDNRLTANSA